MYFTYGSINITIFSISCLCCSCSMILLIVIFIILTPMVYNNRRFSITDIPLSLLTPWQSFLFYIRGCANTTLTNCLFLQLSWNFFSFPKQLISLDPVISAPQLSGGSVSGIRHFRRGTLTPLTNPLASWPLRTTPRATLCPLMALFSRTFCSPIVYYWKRFLWSDQALLWRLLLKV